MKHKTLKILIHTANLIYCIISTITVYNFGVAYYYRPKDKTFMVSCTALIAASLIFYLIYGIELQKYINILNVCTEERSGKYVSHEKLGNRTFIDVLFPTVDGEYRQVRIDREDLNPFKNYNNKKDIPLCYNPENPFEVLSLQVCSMDRAYINLLLLLATLLMIAALIVCKCTFPIKVYSIQPYVPRPDI